MTNQEWKWNDEWKNGDMFFDTASVAYSNGEPVHLYLIIDVIPNEHNVIKVTRIGELDVNGFCKIRGAWESKIESCGFSPTFHRC